MKLMGALGVRKVTFLSHLSGDEVKPHQEKHLLNFLSHLSGDEVKQR